MNRLQKRILILALLLLSLTGIFPPWKIENNGMTIDMGYWWITNPPVKVNSYGYKFSSSINVETLFIQWAIIIMISVGLVCYFKDGK